MQYKPTEVFLQQNTEEWLSFRKKKIGASDSPIIMGVSPWKTAYELWTEKLDIKKPDQMNDAMKRGRDLEETARLDFQKEFGVSVNARTFQHSENEWAIASLDCCTSNIDLIGEIKCPGEKDHREAVLGIVPIKYYPQLQKQMYVSGASKNIYFSWTPRGHAYIEVKRNDEYIKEMISKEKEFYDCMVMFTAPPLTDHDYIKRDDIEWKLLTNEYLSLECAISMHTDRKEEIKKKLISLSGNQNSKGAGITVSRIVRKGNVDYESIPQLKEVDLSAYRKKPVEFWTIRKENIS